MMKWYENHRHNWSYCHDLRFWISFYFLCGWEAVEYGEIPPFCVYAICHKDQVQDVICYLLHHVQDVILLAVNQHNNWSGHSSRY